MLAIGWILAMRSLKIGLAVVLTVFSVACKEQPCVVLVEGVAKSNAVVDYRMVLLSPMGEKTELAKFQESVDLIQCSGHDVSYIDRGGNV